MLLTALLAALVCHGLFVERIARLPLLLLCLAVSLLLLCARHAHASILSIDALARRSRLHVLHAGLKLWGALALLFISLAAPEPWLALLVFLLCLLLTTLGGGLSLQRYLRLLALPLGFLLLSALPLLWDFSASTEGLLALPCFGGYLRLTVASQETARLILARALGALGALYALNLSTTLPELLEALRRVKVPALLLTLSSLLYRYTFIIIETQGHMQAAAASRLGYKGKLRSLRTTGLLYGKLLARSFRRASAHFAAMESRCYQGELRFLQSCVPLRPHDILGVALLILPLLALLLREYF